MQTGVAAAAPSHSGQCLSIAEEVDVYLEMLLLGLWIAVLLLTHPQIQTGSLLLCVIWRSLESQTTAA